MELDKLDDIDFDDFISEEDQAQHEAEEAARASFVYSAAEIDPRLKKLSHSSLDTWRRCPRAHQLNKLTNLRGGDTVHTAYGKMFGVGLQTLFETGGNIELAMGRAFLEWTLPFNTDDTKKKTAWDGLFGLFLFYRDHFKGLMSDYEVFILPNGKPAAELGFEIDLGNGWRYVGFVDLVVRHKRTGMLTVFEVKTTTAVTGIYEMFANSFQGTGYGIVLDAIDRMLGLNGANFEVVYLVLRSQKSEHPLEVIPFKKPFTDRLQWLTQVATEVAVMELHQSVSDTWPLNGSQCWSFGRACEHFGACKKSTAHQVRPPIPGAKEPEYDFHFKIEELLAAVHRK